MITIRPFQNSDMEEVLKLTERSDSTDRSVDTWQGNDMTAMLAFDGKKLIGAVPLEPRIFSLGRGKYIDILWVSGAHVDVEYRNQGIGTQISQKIGEYFSQRFKAVFVYRGDETSPAYRWYKKLNYYEFLPIVAFKKKTENLSSTAEYKVLRTEADIQKWQDKLYACFMRNTKGYGGFPQRDYQFWANRVKSHYYKNGYIYEILVLFCGDTVVGYIFLGQTDMKDGIKRIEMLETILPMDEQWKSDLYNAVMEHAYLKGMDEIRVQLSSQDPNFDWFKSLGFVSRWRTNMMGKLFDPAGYFKGLVSDKINLQDEYRFVIQTPGLGRFQIGEGRNLITLFTHDNVFSEMLMGRRDIMSSIEEGKIVILDGRKCIIDILKDIFPLERWVYFQIDYI